MKGKWVGSQDSDKERVLTTVETLYPRELIYDVGNVVMSAAWVEDKAGELVQLVNSVIPGNPNVPAKGWAASGKCLIEELGKIVDSGLAERLDKALESRNHVVHGVFLGGSSAELRGASWITMKRELGSREPAKYEIAGFGPRALFALADELSSIELIIDDEISYAMGIKERPGV